MLIAGLLLLLPGCSVSPLIPINGSAIPSLEDDLHRKGLNQAIERSLFYLNSQPDHTVIRIADRPIPVSRLAASLAAFQELLKANLSDREMQERLTLDFDIYQAAGSSGGFSPDRSMLVTGYFQPVLEGSLVKEAPYLYPLYGVPPDLVIRPADDRGKKKIGRMEQGRFVDYWTRQEIDTLGKAAGSELVWLKDPLDVFFLQVQGSGHIRLTDGTVRSIHFAAKNGHPYRSIGKHMVQTNRMTLSEASMETIRSYMNQHPDEMAEILFTNPSYIFFSWAEGLGATGNLGLELTPGRSIAADQNCFPAGGLAFLKTRRPVVRSGKIIAWTPVNRFVLVQDSGSAIRGPGRVDMFWGAGAQAGTVAGSMKEAGSLYFFLLRREAQ